MARAKGQSLMCLALLAVLAACGGGREPNLININRGVSTPDEFSILPNKPIEIPADTSALPPPRPGTANRVDPSPQADAVAALGGNPARLQTTGQLRGESGLINHVTRYGVQQGIRQELARQDAEFRQRHQGRILERAFNITVYYRVYEDLSLDQHRELARWRRNGVRTPSAPPEITN
ncbi:DUF3035 domain-containing protein [Alphaproteobacteria bacterium KMM 3653]|uniref:DUF3035 domain-containing protein n=1 Tax=Harenicola maris TaxID=2841044 RepID=A0AAP2G855_9RHOB|nr:DUF3035 domain-containing protein [Harenicola maris]